MLKSTMVKVHNTLTHGPGVWKGATQLTKVYSNPHTVLPVDPDSHPPVYEKYGKCLVILPLGILSFPVPDGDLIRQESQTLPHKSR